MFGISVGDRTLLFYSAELLDTFAVFGDAELCFFASVAEIALKSTGDLSDFSDSAFRLFSSSMLIYIVRVSMGS